jgi:hypothetical protein
MWAPLFWLALSNSAKSDEMPVEIQFGSNPISSDPNAAIEAEVSGNDGVFLGIDAPLGSSENPFGGFSDLGADPASMSIDVDFGSNSDGAGFDSGSSFDGSGSYDSSSSYDGSSSYDSSTSYDSGGSSYDGGSSSYDSGSSGFDGGGAGGW